MGRLKAVFRQGGIIFHEELQPTSEVMKGRPSEGDVSLSKWFLDREIDRNNDSTNGGAQGTISFHDRSFLCTLAYRSAASKTAADEANQQSFLELCDYYRQNKSRFPVYDYVFVFDNDPNATIARRLTASALDDPHCNGSTAVNWMSSPFMAHFREFFVGPQLKQFLSEQTKVIMVPTHGATLDTVFQMVLEGIVAATR
jgi:hypothetical protein